MDKLTRTLITLLFSMALANSIIAQEVHLDSEYSKGKSMTDTIKNIEELVVENVGLVKLGDHVIHPMFGIGKILAIAKFEGNTHTINIEFESAGSKWLVPEYANLQRAE